MKYANIISYIILIIVSDYAPSAHGHRCMYNVHWWSTMVVVVVVGSERPLPRRQKGKTPTHNTPLTWVTSDEKFHRKEEKNPQAFVKITTIIKIIIIIITVILNMLHLYIIRRQRSMDAAASAASGPPSLPSDAASGRGRRQIASGPVRRADIARLGPIYGLSQQ